MRRLDELVEILDHKRVPVNSEDRATRQGDVPYYGANGQQGWIDRPLFNEPLILLAEDGGNFDEFATRPIAYRIEGPSWVNNHAHILRSAPSANQSYLFWSLVHRDIRRYIAGGTRTKLTQGELRLIEIPMPSLPEQQRIAEVLDTLDEAIRKTEQLIAKLKQVKQGLLHDLLTRGINDHGELRDLTRHPEQFKGSPLGVLPLTWRVATLDDMARAIDPQPDHRTPAHVPGGVPYIGVGDFLDESTLDFKSCRRISDRAARKQEARFSLDEGDLLFGKIGTIGHPRHVPRGTRIALSANAMLIKPSAPPAFVRALLESRYVTAQVKEQTHTTSQPAFGIQKLRSLSLPLPPPPEQVAIADTMSAHRTWQASEEQALAKLRLLKHGLMEDLLTGRVRVTALLAEAAT